MTAFELWDNLIQLTVALVGGVCSVFVFKRTGKRCFVFLGLSLIGWALGLAYFVLYLALRGRTPMEPNPAQFVWSGAHLFYIAVIRSLEGTGERGRIPPLAWLAPAVTLPFTAMWFVLSPEGSVVVNLVWGLGMAWIAFESMRALLNSRAAGNILRARYHAAVLAMLLFDEIVLFTELLYQPADYARMNAYFFFDLLVTAALALQVWTLIKAEAA